MFARDTETSSQTEQEDSIHSIYSIRKKVILLWCTVSDSLQPHCIGDVQVNFDSFVPGMTYLQTFV